MYGPGFPHAPPPRQGLSPLVIVLLVLGAFVVLGAGSCVVLGGLVWLGASAEPEPDPVSASPVAPATAAPLDTSGSAASPPEGAEDDPPADDDSSEDGELAAAPSATATAGSRSGTGTWFCNATGWVRVCGFANVCSNQTVSGIGSGSDRMLASMMAKNACENMARAKGGSTVCAVSCTVR